MTNVEANGHKTLCSLILYTVAGISMVLTCTFMYSLGKGAGLGMGVTFAIIGFVFDVVKSYSPTLITQIVRKGHMTAIAIGLISAALISISIAASVFSLQNGVNEALSQTKAAKVIEQQTTLLRKEISDLESMKDQQLKVSHITKATDTSFLISKKREELNTILNKSMTVSEDSLLSSLSTPIILIIAIALEVIGIAMSLSLYHLKNGNETKQDIARRNETQVLATIDETVIPSETRHIMTQNKTVQTSVSSTVSDTMYSSVPTKEQIVSDMRASLLKGDCSPTHRSIYQAFRNCIKQKEVKHYLTELEQRNIIRSTGKGGYVLDCS